MTRTTTTNRPKQRIKFSTTASRKMTAESWNEEIYERQLQIYLDLKGQYTQMESDIKGLQAQLLTYMDSRDIQAAQLDDKQVVICRRKVWRYSDELRREGERIKHAQRREQETGTATFSESVYLTVKSSNQSADED
jgi:hypothetical protein